MDILSPPKNGSGVIFDESTCKVGSFYVYLYNFSSTRGYTHFVIRMFFGVYEIASFLKTFYYFPTYASDPSNPCEIQSVSLKRKHKMTTWRFIFSRKQKSISMDEITGCHTIDT